MAALTLTANDPDSHALPFAAFAALERRVHNYPYSMLSGSTAEHTMLEHVQPLPVCCNSQRIIVEWVLLFEWNADVINQVFC